MTDLIKRINELANKSKTIGLTDLEKEEQNKLRKKYIAAFRGNMKDILLNIKVVDEDGNDCTPEKLKQEKRRGQL